MSLKKINPNTHRMGISLFWSPAPVLDFQCVSVYVYMWLLQFFIIHRIYLVDWSVKFSNDRSNSFFYLSYFFRTTLLPIYFNKFFRFKKHNLRFTRTRFPFLNFKSTFQHNSVLILMFLRFVKALAKRLNLLKVSQLHLFSSCRGRLNYSNRFFKLMRFFQGSRFKRFAFNFAELQKQKHRNTRQGRKLSNTKYSMFVLKRFFGQKSLSVIFKNLRNRQRRNPFFFRFWYWHFGIERKTYRNLRSTFRILTKLTNTDHAILYKFSFLKRLKAFMVGRGRATAYRFFPRMYLKYIIFSLQNSYELRLWGILKYFLEQTYGFSVIVQSKNLYRLMFNSYSMMLTSSRKDFRFGKRFLKRKSLRVFSHRHRRPKFQKYIQFVRYRTYLRFGKKNVHNFNRIFLKSFYTRLPKLRVGGLYRVGVLRRLKFLLLYRTLKVRFSNVFRGSLTKNSAFFLTINYLSKTSLLIVFRLLKKNLFRFRLLVGFSTFLFVFLFYIVYRSPYCLRQWMKYYVEILKPRDFRASQKKIIFLIELAFRNCAAISGFYTHYYLEIKGKIDGALRTKILKFGRSFPRQRVLEEKAYCFDQFNLKSSKGSLGLRFWFQ